MTFAAQPKYFVAGLALLLSSFAIAQVPAAAKPANATGQCKDGTYSTAASKAGACRGHNGVKDWYVATTAPAASATSQTAGAKTSATSPSPAAAKPAAQTPAPTPTQQAAKPSASKGPRANLASTPVAPGGGPGLVWVNTSSNVYHCSGTDFYGKTKAGSYMTEAAAKAKGARPDHGNACSK